MYNESVILMSNVIISRSGGSGTVSVDNIEGVLPIDKGGTGGATVADARTALCTSLATYTSISQLGLTGLVLVSDVCEALPYGSTITFMNNWGTYVSNVPNEYVYLTIHKRTSNDAKCYCSVVGGNNTYEGEWKNNTTSTLYDENGFTGWVKIVNENDSTGGGTSLSLLQKYTTAGTYTYTVPSGVTKIFLAMIGGGGGGISSTSTNSSSKTSYNNVSNGASGCVIGSFVDVVSDSSYSITVGAGGVKADGGSSTAFGYIAAGGGCGTSSTGSYASDYVTSYGGRGSCNYLNASTNIGYGRNLYGVETATDSNSNSGNRILSINNSYENICHIMTYIPPEDCPFLMASNVLCTSTGGYVFSDIETLPNGNSLANYLYYNAYVSENNTTAYKATQGTDPGCGGGSIALRFAYGYGNSGTLTPAAGCDGCVAIYEVS